MRLLVVNVVWLALTCLSIVGAAAAEMPLATGVGADDRSRLSMFFEVTFMKIDVAEIEAWLTPSTAEEAAAIIASTDDRDDARDGIADAVLRADTLLISMEYARDSDHGRLMKGVRNGFEAAMKSDLITEETMERMYEEMSPIFDVMLERGVLEGDRLVYRVDGDDLKVLYVDPEGTTLVEAAYSGPDWVTGMKGAFFGEKSRFRKKLARSLVDRAR
jgi:hypothetical protein